MERHIKQPSHGLLIHLALDQRKRFKSPTLVKREMGVIAAHRNGLKVNNLSRPQRLSISRDPPPAQAGANDTTARTPHASAPP
ncbi:hypothetical protein EVAR_93551_1 [Eumeta japonica]|uniref:Uncharacterized protein n=1 Tax=Eumeta variegata TaxID=151549 RepID=A0A4C1USE5_EUMVA|nr:hypothetical protein EVAR_93551_1 [Eumeta japonica]